ncbi:hypothetical protein Ahia01_000361400 [Argonauta hians]
MFCHLFRRQRNAEKVTRELPPIPKNIRSCSTSNDSDDSSHIYEEIADMRIGVKENVPQKINKAKKNDNLKSKDSQILNEFLPWSSHQVKPKPSLDKKECREIEYKEIDFGASCQSQIYDYSSENLGLEKYSKEQALTKNTECHINLHGCSCKTCNNSVKTNPPDLFSNLNSYKDDIFSNSLNPSHCKITQKIPILDKNDPFDGCKCEKQCKTHCKCDIKTEKQFDSEIPNNEVSFVDLLEHEEMDGNNCCCNYHMNTTVLKEHLPHDSVKEEQIHNPHVVRIINDKHCKGAEMYKCEENIDSVSLTSVSSLPYNCSLSTYVSYNDTVRNRMKSIISSVNSSPFSSFSIKDVDVKKLNTFPTSYCHKCSRKLPEFIAKEQNKEFKISDLNIANEISNTNSSKLYQKSLISSPFEYNGKDRKNHILNDLIYLNYEQLQLKCL